MKKCISVLTLLILTPATVFADDWHAFGLRGGSGVLGSIDQDFWQVGIFATYALPWKRTRKNGDIIQTALNVDLNHLNGPGNQSIVIAVGPQIELIRPTSRVSWNLGIAPTYIEKSRYNAIDMGGNLHFTSHIGVKFEMNKQWELGFRLQHMSNVGLEDSNPGLNLFLIEILQRY